MSAPAERGSRPRAGFLGPAGTFSEEALLGSALPDSVEPVALASIYDAVIALRDGELELAIVPIENSLEGSIDVTLDLLAEQAPSVQIVGEALLRVSHSLIAAEPVALEEIATVLSHPQVPGQCTRFLREELPAAAILPAASTAEAVRAVVAAGDRTTAALGTALAAEIYGGTVLRRGVEDRSDNETRFVWLARGSVDGGGTTLPLRDASSRRRRCSVVFWGAGAERPGWLVRCLDEFAARELNLTKIESRPRRRELGAYMFFVDLDATADQALLDAALDGLRAICEEVRVLGTYAAATPAG